MRSLVVAALIALGACSRPAAKAPTESAYQYELAHTYKVRVDCPGEDNDSGGSAVDIGGGYAITAKHVVDPWVPGCEVELESVYGRKLKSDSVKQSDKADIALIRTPDYVSPMVPFAKPDLGLDVVAIGYPANAYGDDQELGLTKGNIAGLPDREGEVRFTAPIWSGNSGGGVWAGGRLVGLSVSSLLKRQGWFYLVPADAVRPLL